MTDVCCLIVAHKSPETLKRTFLRQNPEAAIATLCVGMNDNLSEVKSYEDITEIDGLFKSDTPRFMITKVNEAFKQLHANQSSVDPLLKANPELLNESMITHLVLEANLGASGEIPSVEWMAANLYDIHKKYPGAEIIMHTGTSKFYDRCFKPAVKALNDRLLKEASDSASIEASAEKFCKFLDSGDSFALLVKPKKNKVDSKPVAAGAGAVSLSPYTVSESPFVCNPSPSVTESTVAERSGSALSDSPFSMKLSTPISRRASAAAESTVIRAINLPPITESTVAKSAAPCTPKNQGTKTAFHSMCAETDFTDTVYLDMRVDTTPERICVVKADDQAASSSISLNMQAGELITPVADRAAAPNVEASNCCFAWFSPRYAGESTPAASPI
ncbi:MAG: hypothetical protein Q7V63_06005 [Gammaproteobacteria bacterium]|nr:hypothetical protein [Gammaproteobacteria bacterium]